MIKSNAAGKPTLQWGGFPQTDVKTSQENVIAGIFHPARTLARYREM